ncbi:uncharacterized transposon-derived [Paramuricea clavata]|uniref:Uncharacterized transposon-derived n=1 Tax=Paramuricea clavata TaxID=317549 RepID=A0A6S7FME4_PARCT|nr:uncharacterized transposon-derived [Paramuricea clavata]
MDDDFMSSQLSQGRSDEYLGDYDTDIIDSDDEMDFFEGWLLDEWNTDDVLHWLDAQGLRDFKQGFKDKKIDGMCLKEGLSEEELNSCHVQTVGESKAKMPRLQRSVLKKLLSPQQKDDLLRRRKQVHRKTVAMFPGNNIPVFRGNANAQKHFQELTVSCQEHVNPDIGYDEEELRRHIRAILDERRRMVREGYNYEDNEDPSSTDQDEECSKRSQSPILIAEGKKERSESEENNSGSETELPEGAQKIPLTTAETIILAYFKKGYTKEVKKDLHLLPLGRDLKVKNLTSKDKTELMMVLSKELLLKKLVTLKDDADFYCLHRDSVIVMEKKSQDNSS